MCAKCAELVIHDGRRKRQLVLPSLLLDVTRVQALKVLGVTINHNLSVSDHVTNVIRSSAQTVHALRLLRAHGMADPVTPYGVPSSHYSQADVCCQCLVEFGIRL